MNRKLIPNIGYVMWWRGTGGGNPGERREVGGKREEAERDAGVMRGREAREE